MQPSQSNERYEELARKWLSGIITDTEKQEFANWFNEGQDNKIKLPEGFVKNEREHKRRIYKEISRHMSDERINSFVRPAMWYAAASIFLIVALGVYYYPVDFNKVARQMKSRDVSTKLAGTVQSSGIKAKASPKDIEPGKDRAILTLSDGRKVILDDASNGLVAKQGGHIISKTSDGEIIYSFSPSIIFADSETVYNTIEAPKGGKFTVKLPDGSKVWLNAASSLRFPTTFEGSKFQVFLTGEAYFEVSRDTSRIFEVSTSGQKVQVLGTHFNINAYENEPYTKTTLLEGSVKVLHDVSQTSEVLKPGEQAKLKEHIEVVNIGRAQEVVAWKDGYFQFNQADIKTVMRQIERWYDVTVRYEGELPDYQFGGEIERSLTLLQVLKILEKMDVHFRVEGKEVVVMK